MQTAKLVFLLSATLAWVDPVMAQSAKVDGDWEISVHTPQGTRNVKASFTLDGTKLGGTIRGSAGSIPIEGTLTGKEIKFSYSIPFQGSTMTITMTGEIDGDDMKGTADFGGFAAGDWTGKRATAEATVALVSPPTGPPVDASGDWEVTINAPTGTNTVEAAIKQEGEKLSGVLKGRRGEVPFEGSARGKEVKVTFTIQFEGNPMVITLTGDLEGDAIKGGADFGGLATGDWSGKRKGKEAPAAPPAEKIDISGSWIFEVETSMGSGSPTFTFKQEGENLTGQYKGLFGEATLTGTVKENTVTFSFKVSAQGIEGVVTYTGTIEKDSMKGTATLGDLGTATWTAKRK